MSNIISLEPIHMDSLQELLLNPKNYAVGTINTEVNHYGEYRNIEVHFASIDGSWYRIEDGRNNLVSFGQSFKENGKDVLEPLSERFGTGELIRIEKIRDNFNPIPRVPYFTYGNETSHARHQCFDVVRGKFNDSELLYEPATVEYKELVAQKLKRNRDYHLYVLENQGGGTDVIWGPFVISTSIRGGETFPVRAVASNSNTIWRFEDTNKIPLAAFESAVSDNLAVERTVVFSWLNTSDGTPLKILDNTEFASWLSKQIESTQNLSSEQKDFLKILPSTLKHFEIEESERSLIERSDTVLKRINQNITLFSGLIEELPNIQSATAKLKSIEHKHQKIQQEIEEKNRLLNEKQTAFETLLDKEKLQNEKLQKIQDDIEKYEEDELQSLKGQMENLQDEIDKKQQEMSSMVDKEDLCKSLEDLRNEKLQLKGANDDLRETKSQLTEIVACIKKEFREEQKEAGQQLTEWIKTKTHLGILIGEDFSDSAQENTKWGKFAIAEKAIEENENETVESQLVSGVKDELVRAGRRFPPQFIANVLLSVHQNTFTILAGPPGSGKTSFARLLTSALVPCERCREISVSRGWTSFKDLIGFSNPLTQKFHESNTELYSLLQQLDYECTEDTARQSPLAFVILDEANLSPIEHYWSIFYNRTDNFCTDTYMTLSFGGDERLQYANNIRFIGTINTDMTTEQLSPRILDRVNVIRMPELDSSNFMNSPDDFYEPAPVNSTGMSLDQVIEIFDLPDFKNKSKYQVQNAVYEQFLKLIEPLRKVGIRVSPRLKVAAQRFLSAAERYINDEMKPLDYFVAQRILPQLSVQGEEYLPHLKSIRSACHL